MEDPLHKLKEIDSYLGNIKSKINIINIWVIFTIWKHPGGKTKFHDNYILFKVLITNLHK